MFYQAMGACLAIARDWENVMLYNTGLYRQGKIDHLAGVALPTPPSPATDSQKLCDYRSGWHVAEANKRDHPDWSDAQIIA